MLKKIVFSIFIAFPLWAGAVEHWATQAGAGAQDGTSLADAWPQGSIAFGTAAGQVGRGDTLYLCGTAAAPITVTVTPTGIGAFDGTVNADSDILIFSGDTDQCGGTEGYLDPASSHAINASGQPAVYIQDLTCNDAANSCFQQLLSSSNTCAASAGYYCGLQRDLTCTSSGLTSGHCASISTQTATSFPAASVTGLLQENVTSYAGGGAACNIRMHATGATQRNCKSYRDGQVSNIWGVYQSGVTINSGAANSGAGVTWTQVSGNVYKTTQTTFGAGAGLTIVSVYAAVTGVGVVGNLALDAGCVTNDATCAAALSAGEFGQIGDVLYVNRGLALAATAAIYVTYAINTDPVITQSFAEDFSDVFDGVGIGLDFGVTGGLIERSYGRDNPGYNLACGGGAINCTIRSSLSGNAGIAAIRHGGGGGVVENVSSTGNAVVVSARAHQGETITYRNVAADEDTDIALLDTTGGGNDGTLDGGASELWRPDELGADLALWLDADDASTITLNGSTVSQWDDKSGNDHHATQATASNQPTYTPSGLNGKPVLTFDGTDDFMSVPDFDNAVSLALISSGGSILSPLIAGAAPALFSPAWNVNRSAIQYRGRTDTSIRQLNLGGSGNDFAIGFISLDAASSEVRLSGNGGAQTTFSHTINSADTTINTLGRDFQGGTQFADGRIAEIVVASSLLSTDDRQKLEGYLAHKWGLTANLPADHPYKTTPPTASVPAPQVTGEPSPTTALSFRPRPNSPLLGAGTYSDAKYDYNGVRFGNPPNIGAFATTPDNKRSTYVERY